MAVRHSIIYGSVLTVGSILLYHYTNLKRVEAGYFQDPLWITINTFSYILFFAVVTGFVVAVLLKKTKNRKKNRK